MTAPERNKKTRRVVLSVINDLTSDQRVHRMAATLREWGFQPLVVGRLLPESKPLNRTYETRRMRLFFRKGKLFYLEYNFRLFWLLLFQKADVFAANDLDTLTPNFLVARLRRKKLVYDAHELFTEVPEVISRPLVRKTWLSLERALLPKIGRMITVNDSLARIYESRYSVKAVAVRNVPFRKPQLNAPKANPPVLLYQGAVNIGRGVDLMLRALVLLPEYQLWIIGGGDVLDEMKQLAEKLNLQDRTTFFGRIPFEELAEYTAQATIGFSLEEDLGLNYRYASPNKVFDYIQQGVPHIVADLPEMRALVERYETGLVLDERTPECLADAVRRLCETIEMYEVCKRNASKASAELCWENEREKLREIYFD